MTDQNDRAIGELAWAIENSLRNFKLLFFCYNYDSDKLVWLQRLREICRANILAIELSVTARLLYQDIQAQLGEEEPEALLIFGLEAVQNLELEKILERANAVREEFRARFCCPVVFWVNNRLKAQFIQFAPDLESWGTTIRLAIAPEDAVRWVRETADRLLAGEFSVSKSKVADELALMRQYFRDNSQVLTAEIEADLAAILGFDRIWTLQLDKGLTHFQTSLAFWDSEIGERDRTSDRADRLILEIAFCYYLLDYREQKKKLQYWVENRPNLRHNLKNTKDYLYRYLASVNLPDQVELLTEFLDRFGRVLRYLGDWDTLEALARGAILRHQKQNDAIHVARDWGYLAEVALVRENWQEAQQLAQRALTNLPTTLEPLNSNPYAQEVGHFRFLLANAQEKLSQIPEALSNLELARTWANPQNNLPLYCQILSDLQRLYFATKNYLAAFEAKQEKLAVEQLFGVRAFVGAGRLGATRLQQKTNGDRIHNSIAPEIALFDRQMTLFGRESDVERLVKRMGQNEGKLSVIHGQSGVGKSSLLEAGLVPALRGKTISTREAVPVLVRVYSHWESQLEQALVEADLIQPGELESPSVRDGVEESESPSPRRGGVGEGSILACLQQCEAHRLVVLIFDQFEEFFFDIPEPKEQRRFFEFLGQCLAIGSLKVMLSLREDYLHYLLKWDAVLKAATSIDFDILSQINRHPLGNFSLADARMMIEKRSRDADFLLDEALLDELVGDLADEFAQVRPIELQVVGAQLQEENITTLVGYRERGGKEALVDRYLEDVTESCGGNNQAVAQRVLFLLTDESGTRPKKTREELEGELRELSSESLRSEHDTSDTLKQSLNLVLQILVESGLVFQLPDVGGDRYQLVHDYLVGIIRRQQEPSLLAALKRSEEKRQQAEAELAQSKQILADAEWEVKRKVRYGLTVLAVSFVGAAAAVGASIRASQNLREVLEGNRLERASVQARRQFDTEQIPALLSAVRAGWDLQKLLDDGRFLEAYPLIEPILTLEQILQKIQERNVLQGHQAEVWSAVFSPDGKKILTASRDKTALLWDKQGKILAELKGHQAGVSSAVFSPDGEYILTASGDSTARLWNKQGKVLAELKGHQAGVGSAVFSPDGEQILTASGDSTARLWNKQGKVLAELRHQFGVRSAVFSPDGEQILTASSADSIVRLWDKKGNLLDDFKSRQVMVRSAVFSPDGEQILTASADSIVRLWDRKGNLLADFKSHQGRVSSVAFSPDGEQILTASADSIVRLWDKKGNLLADFKGHQDWVSSVAFSPDGEQILTASADKTARLWDKKGNLQDGLKRHQGLVRLDGEQILTASYDNTARFRQVENLNKLLERGCTWLDDYLRTNPKVTAADKAMCEIE
jgi:WD40 repeat protein